MRVIAALQADLEVTPIGTKSRLAHELGGIPVLRRTVDRLGAVPSIERVFVLVSSGQVERCRRILQGMKVEVVAHQAGPSPWSALVRSARKWSLDGWRGGIGGATGFDEFCDCRVLEGLLRHAPADAVMVVPPGAAVLDPGLTERLIAHRRTAEEDTRLAFTPTPPGIAGILLDASLIRELAASNLPVGWLFSYQPSLPRKDLIFQPCCMEAPPVLRFAAGRLIADTDRAMRRLVDLLAAHADPDAETIGSWLHEREVGMVDDLPHEVEIELTTDDPFPNAVLHPRGTHVPGRGPLDSKLFGKIADDLARLDDSLVVLGGFGDPLKHPHFTALLRTIRPAESVGTYGVCIRTRGVNLTDAAIQAVIEARIDVLNVILDAWSPRLFSELACPSALDSTSLEHVLSRIERVTALREKRGSVVPIVIPEFTKSRLNLHEMDEFYDGWVRKIGAASIVGASHRAGQLPDHTPLNMAPSPREACRRLRSRCLVLADGSVVACDQDFQGLNPSGNLRTQSLRDLWTGSKASALREAHSHARWNEHRPCAACNEWHRP